MREPNQTRAGSINTNVQPIVRLRNPYIAQRFPRPTIAKPVTRPIHLGNRPSWDYHPHISHGATTFRPQARGPGGQDAENVDSNTNGQSNTASETPDQPQPKPKSISSSDLDEATDETLQLCVQTVDTHSQSANPFSAGSISPEETTPSKVGTSTAENTTSTRDKPPKSKPRKNLVCFWCWEYGHGTNTCDLPPPKITALDQEELRVKKGVPMTLVWNNILKKNRIVPRDSSLIKFQSCRTTPLSQWLAGFDEQYFMSPDEEVKYAAALYEEKCQTTPELSNEEVPKPAHIAAVYRLPAELKLSICEFLLEGTPDAEDDDDYIYDPDAAQLLINQSINRQLKGLHSVSQVWREACQAVSYKSIVITSLPMMENFLDTAESNTKILECILDLTVVVPYSGGGSWKCPMSNRRNSAYDGRIEKQVARLLNLLPKLTKIRTAKFGTPGMYKALPIFSTFGVPVARITFRDCEDSDLDAESFWAAIQRCRNLEVLEIINSLDDKKPRRARAYGGQRIEFHSNTRLVKLSLHNTLVVNDQVLCDLLPKTRRLKYLDIQSCYDVTTEGMKTALYSMDQAVDHVKFDLWRQYGSVISDKEANSINDPFECLCTAAIAKQQDPDKRLYLVSHHRCVNHEGIANIGPIVFMTRHFLEEQKTLEAYLKEQFEEAAGRDNPHDTCDSKPAAPLNGNRIKFYRL